MSVADRDLTLADLIEYNRLRPFEERKALLYGEGPTFQIRTLSDELPSILIGGLPNFGKTSCMAFLCSQIVMCGGQLVVIDPHLNAPKDSLAKIVAPLSPWFALPLVDFEDTRQVVKAFQFVEAEYERRNRKNASNFYPLFLIADEWNILLDMLEDDEYEAVIKAVRTVARAARKFGIWLCLAAQNWNLDSSGGPEVRKSITGRISFAQELSDMRMTLATKDNRSLADLTSVPLGKGQAIFKHPSYGMKRVWFPPMDTYECEIVAQNMRSCSALSAPISAKFDGISVPECHDTPSPAIKPNPNESRSDTPPECDLNVPESVLKVQITASEYKMIIEQGTRQLQETGKVVRTKLRDDLGWDNYGYEKKIKPVCDALGWHHRMKLQKISPEQRTAILEQFAYKCAECGATEDLTIDHKVPRVKGGSNEPDNLQVLCRSCNSKKGITA